MSTNIVCAEQISIDTISDGPVAIDQSKDSLSFPAERIIAVISELHVCYDYCAAWKETPPDEITASTECDS